MTGACELQMFGPFLGHDAGDDECEVMLWLLWPEKERKREPALFGQKWWDYRSMSAVHATYLFSHYLTLEVRRIIRTHIDNTPPGVTASGRIVDWHPIKSGDVLEAPSSRIPYWRRKVLGLIRARQAADADGIPYDVFVNAGLHHFYFGSGTYVLQRADQNGKRTVIPEPNLLYGADCLLHIRQTWLEKLAMQVQASKHPRFLVANADAHPDHAQHQAWIAQQLAARPVQEWAAARLVKEGLLTQAAALSMVRNPAELSRRLS